MTATYMIEQQTAYQYELIENGNCATLEEARRCMADLEQNLGWTGLRIVEAESGDAVEYGTPSDDREGDRA